MGHTAPILRRARGNENTMIGSMRKQLHWFTTLAASSLLAVSTVCAQEPGKIIGTIADAITGDPIAEVTIAIRGSDVTGVTDEHGFYTIDSVPPGLIKFTASVLGYHPITSDYYTIFPDRTVQVDFSLAPLAFEVEGVEITGRTEKQLWHTGTNAQVLTSEDLPRRGNILNALGSLVPGVRTIGRRDDTRLVVRNGRNDVLYVIDGTVVRPPLQFYIDSSDVECVEVRRGMNAALQFKQSLNSEMYSGVVLIWTREVGGSPRPAECQKGKN